LDQLSLPSIAWAHITPSFTHLRRLAACAAIKALVCVEHEQHDHIYDTAVHSKLTYIVNGFDLGAVTDDTAPLPARDPNLVIYLGALTPQKGFHRLAQVWPDVIRHHPHAKLAVIGSGHLYGANTQLGPWGIAEQGYERRFIQPHLADTDGQPIPSVTFLGKLGPERYDWIKRAAIGIANPTGNTENCPGSVLEISALGTPVISAARYGLLDTVIDCHTGLLCRGKTALTRAIVELLSNPAYARQLGQAGPTFVNGRYHYAAVCQQWLDLLTNLQRHGRPIPHKMKNNLWAHSKFLQFCNRPLQASIGRLVFWPAVLEIKERISMLKQAIQSYRRR
jgi:glycosyltransferase involved in cell wall biosynthesis